MLATFTVTNLDSVGDGSLRKQIDLANETPGADRIEFESGLAGTIDLSGSGSLHITGSLRIVGPGADVVTVRASRLDRVFTVTKGSAPSDVPVEISGLTMEGGDLGFENGGVIWSNEDLVIRDATLVGGRATFGGAVYSELASVHVERTELRGNAALRDAGSFAISGTGGALYASRAEVTIVDSTFTGNEATLRGGAVFSELGELTVEGSTFQGNVLTEALGKGGAIHSDRGAVRIAKSTIRENIATLGGGYYGEGRAFTEIVDSTFFGNQASTGGAVHASDVELLVVQSTLSGNQASVAGGAIYHFASQELIDRIVEEGEPQPEYDPFEEPYPLKLIHSTITENSAERGGGLLLENEPGEQRGRRYLVNSILAGNTASSGAGPDALVQDFLFHQASVLGFFGGDGELCATALFVLFTEPCVARGAIPDDYSVYDVADPLLFPLADNGGPTRTHALLPGSPAIDVTRWRAGLDYDQRGAPFARSIDANGDGNVRRLDDAGAFESAPLTAGDPFVVSLAADESDGNFAPGDLSLREAVELSELLEGPDTITFDPALAFQTIELTRGQIDISTPLSIQGLGAKATVIDAGGNSRIFEVANQSLSDVEVELADLTLTGGRVENAGGGAILTTENVTLRRVHLTGNAARVGGAISVSDSTSRLRLVDSALTDNEASEAGGAIWSRSQDAEVNQTTIAANRASRGGGVHVVGDLTVRYSTIAGNTATESGGGISRQGGNLTLDHALVADNVAPSGPDVDGNVFASLYSLIEDTSGVSLGTSIGSVLDTEARLAPLSDNGGPTPTRALLPDSPAIDAGQPSTTRPSDFDQRGTPYPRILDGDNDGSAVIDIGAFERPATDFLVVNLATDEDDGNYTLDDLSLREAVRIANENAGDALITFSPNLANRPVTLTLGELAVTDTVTIDGGAVENLTIEQRSGTRIFRIDDGDFSRDVSVEITGVRLTGGQAPGTGEAGLGGAILNREDLLLDRVTVQENTARAGGGAIYSNDGALQIRFSTITDNEATGGAATGGAIGTAFQPLTISSSTLANNSSGGTGGGIYAFAGEVEMVNSTVSGNQANRGGGGITLVQSAKLDAAHVTITGNVADADNTGGTSDRGGGIYNVSGNVNLSHAIVAANRDFSGAARDLGGVATLRYTLLGDDTGASIVSAVGNQIGSGNARIDPQLGPLAYNGGPTPTHLPRAGSPVVDAGSSASGAFPAFDQRNKPFVRQWSPGSGIGTVDFLDLGAVELQALNPTGLSLVVDTAVDEIDGNFEPGDRSLREALALANGSAGADSITFAPQLQSETLLLQLGQLVISDHLLIEGPGDRGVVIDAGNNSRIFLVDDGSGTSTIEVELRRLTLSGGRAAEGGAGNDGGAIYSSETLRIFDSLLSGNEALGDGGAVFGDHSQGGSTTIHDSILRDNTARQDGGAIMTVLGAVDLRNTLLDGNAATRWGGGLRSFSSTVTVDTSRLRNNSSENGAGFYADFGSAQFAESQISDNVASGDGGGVMVVGGILTVDISDVLRNVASSNGGGLLGRGATLEVTRSEIADNVAQDGRGGGLVGENGAAATIEASTFAGNRALLGGGIDSGGRLLVVNSTFSGNEAEYGGGIRSDGETTLRHSTLTANLADLDENGVGGGAGLYAEGGTVEVNHVILAANKDLSKTADDIASGPANVPINASYSLIGSRQGANLNDVGGTNQIGTAASPISPGLDSLDDYGGPTRTHRLRQDSRARNAGQPGLVGAPDFDQRGNPFARIGEGRIDVGAVEFREVQVSVTNSTEGSEIGPTAGSVTIELDEPTFSDVDVLYTVAGTAASNEDYQPLSGLVSLPAGETSARIAIPVLDDNVVEERETVLITLAAIRSDDGDVVIDASKNVALVSIEDDGDEASIALQGVADGNESGQVAGYFEVTMTAPSGTETQVAYQLESSSTATIDSDFAAPSGSVSIPAGATGAAIAIPVLDDLIVERPETVRLRLTEITSGDSELSLDNFQNVDGIRLLDDDTAVISIHPLGAGAEQAEVPARFEVRSSALVAYDVNVRLQAGGSATNDRDYDYTPRFVGLLGRVTLPAEATSLLIELPVYDDQLVEPTERIEITLRDFAPGSALGLDPERTMASVDLLDNDSATVRIVPADKDDVRLVADIQPGASWADPQGITAAGGRLFFTADDGVHGRELWMHDPVSGSTELVADIRPGAGDAFAGEGLPGPKPQFTQLGDQLFFVADDGMSGGELWRHDLASGDTSRVADIRGGSETSDIDQLTVLDGSLFFAADEGTNGRELWRHVPSLDATELVADIRSGPAPGAPFDLTVVQSQLFFTAAGVGTGRELWNFNPATEQVSLVSDIEPGSSGSFPRQLFVHDARLLFAATTAAAGEELWEHDPQTGVTRLLADIQNGPGDSAPSGFHAFGEDVYFRADDGVTGRELWVLEDGTDAVSRVVDLWPGERSSSPGGLISLDERLYFVATTPTGLSMLWNYDPTTGSTTLTSGATVAPGALAPIALDGQLYFVARERPAVSAQQLWRHDPDRGISRVVRDIRTGDSPLDPRSAVALDGALFFSGRDDAQIGRELWKVSRDEGTDALEEGALPGRFSLVQSLPASTATEVTYGLGGTATAGADYAALSGTVTLSAFTTVADLPVWVIDDAQFEPTETVVVQLSGFANADEDIGLDAEERSATVRIIDNDNAPPTAEAGGPYSVDEGGSVTLFGSATDPNPEDVLTYVWDLDGDGSFETSGPAPLFDASGLDGPSTLTVTLRVDDGNGGVASDTATVAVNNVAPIVEAAISTRSMGCSVARGETVSVSGRYTDRGALDTHEVRIDWQDGTVSVAEVDPAERTFSASHVYTTAGFYEVNVQVTDDDAGVGTRAIEVAVQGASLRDGVLRIVGTEHRDHVSIHPGSPRNDGGKGPRPAGGSGQSGSMLVVRTNLSQDHTGGRVSQAGKPETVHVPRSAIQRIDMLLCGGNDHVNIHPHVDVPGRIDAGEGDDYLSGGAGDDTILGGPGRDYLRGRGGDDVLLGGDGDDKLHGRDGNDVLTGGSGSDDLYGGDGNDILTGGADRDKLMGDRGEDIVLGGETAYDQRTDALRLLLAQWTSNEPFERRIEHLREGTGVLAASGVRLAATGNERTAWNDAATDTLFGKHGRDWFFADLDGDGGNDDLLKDRDMDETLDVLLD